MTKFLEILSEITYNFAKILEKYWKNFLRKFKKIWIFCLLNISAEAEEVIIISSSSVRFEELNKF